MILIVGAGNVGSNIAADLAPNHDVTVVDSDPERVDALTARLDVTGVVGDGRSAAVLGEASIDRAEIVVASTDRDATNVMVCNAAKRWGDADTIARVKDGDLYRSWQSLDGGLGVDAMRCLDDLAADALVRTCALPGAKAVDTFAEGVVEVAEFDIEEGASIAGQTVAAADRYASVTFAALLRDGGIVIPDGETVIRAGDSLVVIGSLSGIGRFAASLDQRGALDSTANVVVVGSDGLGSRIARRFESRGWEPRLVEPALEASTVPAGGEGDDAEPTIEGIDPGLFEAADLVVGAADDETNYLLGQLARELGVGATAVVVEDPTLVDLVEESGLDVVVHPEDLLIGDVLRVIYGSGPETVGTLDHDDAEILEVVVDTESVLAGRTLGESAETLPGGVVVGAIIRDGQLELPRGNRVIETGDRVIAFVDAEVAPEVSEAI
ncbi:Trk system potassium transporter TrkA [Halalkalicoccus jeotgali]|uniref:Potassium transporter peripheral membrane component n=1 Tax=Halalkalicoccus jeotgali (strain DSM 18796 / CECT 7217 / JCM 14584 / KCTC 4019 / B3) TaxID=795797 RepID=D8J4T7_HALJB|nr:Trk system potassium transporter TrkA [Halalkalicoccus jeotgali]ADJ15554.1 potassium transporter peripheral membrane component [Halalkalicoccus jeotgali B3]ELY36037.1 potassium transporter peripheral membrane component [Halalkalicoccus jeotgali B3]